MPDTTQSEVLIARDEVFVGRILRVEVDTVRLPDGARATREVVRHPGAVAVVPILPDGRILLVRQYRHAAGKSLWEIPAGKLDVAGESPLECAVRELREETGYAADDWNELFTFYTSPGFTDERIVLFAALELTKVADPVPDEIAEQAAFTRRDLLNMITRGEVDDGKTILAVAWLWMESH